jgi:hypothetical protein
MKPFRTRGMSVHLRITRAFSAGFDNVNVTPRLLYSRAHREEVDEATSMGRSLGRRDPGQ